MTARLGAAFLAAVMTVTAGSALAAGPPSPDATAGDPLLTSKVDAAIAGATSYRIAVRAPGVALDIRSFGPDRVQIEATAGSAVSESVVVGTAMYYRPAGSPWQAFAVPPVRSMRHNRLYMALPDALLQPLPERVEDGVAYGAFRSQATGNGGVPGIMDCTYERGTYRPHACTVTLAGSAAPIRVAYAGWDDPANAVEPPPGVEPPRAPAPSPSLSPAPRGGQ